MEQENIIKNMDCAVEEDKTDPKVIEKLEKQEEKMKKEKKIMAELQAKHDKLTSTPFNKIKLPIDADYKNIVLALTGSFYPIHNNHIRMLTKAKEYFEKNFPEYTIVGGYIIPTHSSGLRKKMGVQPFDYQKRVTLCQLATEDSDWIDVDPYLIA